MATLSSRNYNPIMRTRLISVGNSKGIRLPKAMLEAAGLEDWVTLRVEKRGLLISPSPKRRKPRQGWAEAIETEIGRAGVSNILGADLESLPNDWDVEDWKC